MYTCKKGHSGQPYITNRGENQCRACRSESVCRWQTRNKEKLSEIRRFGGNRENAIIRDGEKCVKCNMSREAHRLKYGRDITVDHIDGNGRKMLAKDQNNSMENLQTLCLPCHGSKDVARRKVHSNKWLKLKEVF